MKLIFFFSDHLRCFAKKCLPFFSRSSNSTVMDDKYVFIIGFSWSNQTPDRILYLLLFLNQRKIKISDYKCQKIWKITHNCHWITDWGQTIYFHFKLYLLKVSISTHFHVGNGHLTIYQNKKVLPLVVTQCQKIWNINYPSIVLLYLVKLLIIKIESILQLGDLENNSS